MTLGNASPGTAPSDDVGALPPEPPSLAAPVHLQISAQASATPGAVAVRDRAHHLTYAALDARSRRIAAALRRRGVRPGELVAVSVARSADLVAALLGVLHAGAAYVPLDPSHPPERLRYIREDAGARFVVTDRSAHGASTGPWEGGTPLSLPCLAAEDGPVSPSLPGPWAYAIYTSGTTGRPKGVLVPHASLANFLASMRELPGIRARDLALAVTTVSFDIAALELLLPLTVGAQVVVADEAAVRDGAALARLVEEHGITLVQGTPSTFDLLLEEGWSARGVKVLVGGEPVPRRLTGALRAAGAEVWVMYGPTETTIWSTTRRVVSGGAEPAGGASETIGRPIRETRLHVLDPMLRPVPDGEPGELCIAGAGVAGGYVRRPGLTAERFVPEPGPGAEGRRMYRTGDLARRLPDGDLELLGRADAQVKLNGFRIELEEIEAVLREDPAVRRAAAALRDGPDGNRQLVACVVARDAAPRDEETAVVEAWRSVWDHAHRSPPAQGDPTLNVAGYRSAFGGALISEDEAREWVEASVGRIRAGNPRRILEIGCGSGMLLSRLLPDAALYVGLDPSAEALARAAAAIPPEARHHAVLLPAAAHELRSIAASLPASVDAETPFDAVVLNSVVQYFPGTRYLEEVLRDALALLRPGGHLFVGDVRNARLLAPFHAAVLDGAGQLAGPELEGAIARAVAREEELVVDPELFLRFLGTDGIAAVRVVPRRGCRHTEFTRYRFDVSIVPGPAPDLVPALPWTPYTSALRPAALRAHLNTVRPELLCVTDVPDARLAPDRARRARRDGSPAPADDGVDPEALWALEGETGYDVLLSLAAGGEDGSFDLVCRRRDAAVTEAQVWAALARDRRPARSARLLPDDPALFARLASRMRERLPPYMVPGRLIRVSDLPRTPNGKLDRRALQALVSGAVLDAPVAAPVPGEGAEEALIARVWTEVLRLDRPPDGRSFFDLGGTSLAMARVRARLNAALGTDLTVTDLFAHPSIPALAARLRGAASAPRPARLGPPPAHAPQDVAIVGMAARVPGAPDVAAFWELIVSGREGLEWFSPEGSAGTDGVVPVAGVLAEGESFDAALFGIPEADAALTDPQQRVFLECCFTAVEDAGYDPFRCPGTVGVFAAAGPGAPAGDYLEGPLELRQLLGTDRDYLATRVAYRLNLRGPAMTVQTACSSSLVAVHYACRSLLAGESDMALAGGVTLRLPQRRGHRHREGMILSRDGHNRAFAAGASGTVFTNGAGVVVLKRLADALRDGDPIRAVIRGSAVNNDGGEKAGFTAPSLSGQADVIARALASAGVEAASVRYLEAHGTATEVGDPIEVAALKRVFGGPAATPASCALGSVKSNIGHTIAAAGVAGLIKAALVLAHRVIPPSPHGSTPNPALALDGSPFYLSTRARPFGAEEGPLRAGVSSFGLGGTNAHVVLEEPPRTARPRTPEGPGLLLLSAPTEAGLLRSAAEMAAFLRGPDASLRDAAYTAFTGRPRFAHRVAVVGQRADEVADALDAVGTPGGPDLARDVDRGDPAVLAVLFPGQGTRFAEVGRMLLGADGVARDTLVELDEVSRDCMRIPLLDVLRGDGDPSAETELAQPALFAVELAIHRLWTHRGFEPTAVLGHSVGEYTAACVSGVLTPAETLGLLALRGRLMAALPPGAMWSVFADPDTALAAAEGDDRERIALAAVNGPALSVLSGDTAAVEAAAERLRARGIEVRRLPVRHAFHAPAVEAMLDALEAAAARLRPREPRIALLSNVSGRPFRPGERPDAAYWRLHARSPVAFSACLDALVAMGYRRFLEAGPGGTLTALGRLHPAAASGAWVPGLAADAEGVERPLLRAAARLLVSGYEPRPDAFLPRRDAQRVSMPTHVFDRRAYPSSPAPNPVPAMDQPATTARVVDLVASLLGVTAATVDPDARLVALGMDSVMLIDLTHRVAQDFGVQVAVRDLFGTLATPRALAARVAAAPAAAGRGATPVPAEVPGAAAPARSPMPSAPATPPGPPTPSAPAAPPDAPTPAARPVPRGDETGLHALLARQVDLLSAQLALLAAAPPPVPAAAGSPASALPPPGPDPAPPAPARPARPTHAPFSFHGVQGEEPEPLSPAARTHLDGLVERLVRRTAGSRAHAARFRPVHADRRSLRGLRFDTREIFYPIIGREARGSRFTDVDGNEYLDITMGFGVHLFGHAPGFVLEALRAQLERGLLGGPQAELSGPVAEAITRLTGSERVTFANSGTEAVMTALRVARAATGRDEVVIFKGSYHGHFDGTLATARGGDGSEPAVPMFPGTPAPLVAATTVLEYGHPRTLAYVEAHAGRIAAVLAEPVQSRAPSLQPVAFLREMREITRRKDIALVFDEVIHGFRIHPGGVQAHFGIDADLVTYGKAVGGGMPIGVVAGRSRFLDRIDGGAYRFGDGSYPGTEPTYFAGTFCKHPLAMAAAHAVLAEMERRGPALQAGLTALTERFATRMNAWFESEGLPLRIEHFGSLFRVVLQGGLGDLYLPLEMDLLFYHLLERGVYVWEGRVCFLSAAHTTEDVDTLVEAFQASATALREGGFFLTAACPDGTVLTR